MGEPVKSDPDYVAVREVLWRWDFVRVGEDREWAASEYDAVATALLSHLRQSPDVARSWLARELSENWALNVPSRVLDNFFEEVRVALDRS
jgi:hypothetical protein